ncbi:hypothetical protein CGCF415_v003455 [Colletotrichum fructicola]|nr:hypothetical protein CGCFRS4_v001703 [Colletotrichum fructicola]KAF4912874.1 hypothetical protein CGCF415_v003455 [Colletotrichum fructicola]KAF4934909.1 hypothetical protein CGCF245_v008132 [Colletotrichum fructicola]
MSQAHLRGLRKSSQMGKLQPPDTQSGTSDKLSFGQILPGERDFRPNDRRRTGKDTDRASCRTRVWEVACCPKVSCPGPEKAR